MTSPVTILLLDDEPLLRRATALMLSNRGAQVTAATSADEAVALAEERLYDVAIFDVSRPGPSAVEVLRRMRAGGLVPRRVIAVAGAALAAREASEFTEILQKPYPFESLLRVVFGQGSRRRTQSGVFPSVRPRATPSGPPEVAGRAPRRAARALRGRGG